MTVLTFETARAGPFYRPTCLGTVGRPTTSLASAMLGSGLQHTWASNWVHVDPFCASFSSHTHTQIVTVEYGGELREP
jgi:hypothetical protein